MSHGKLRKDKTCLNCNYVVENKFCPNCGQENTETRQSFHYLFTHFVEDLTHYDGSFWKTIKALLFKPGKLTKEYLAGKRKLYVPPVKLYIFISFVAFLLPKFLPDYSLLGTKPNKSEKEISFIIINKNDKFEMEVKDTILVSTVKELDSVQKILPENDKISFIDYQGSKAMIKLSTDNNQKHLIEKAAESFVHTLAKVLFIYMPFFALLLWIIHNKKKHYYFDHGIFTLHYFTLLLLLTTLLIVVNWISKLLYYNDVVSKLSIMFFLSYSFFYFFRAHSNFYGEKKYISRLKSLSMFLINMFLIVIISIFLFLYNIAEVH